MGSDREVNLFWPKPPVLRGPRDAHPSGDRKL
ncbi:hypothetical protein HNR21_003141 [Actinomadura cellulosilytica]|uniref:Uncharacterized protein n=1 Tax=Thermomonospora cellulosilytica TaxID=1411118 RepID=A0A7W3R946_9ACTN|nr:hypothetical protein [Thermomonospora cellulosilytica]